MRAAARVWFSWPQAMPHQAMKCTIQAAAANCWPGTDAPASPTTKPPCGKTQTVSHPNISAVDHDAAANARPTGRGSELNRTELRERRSAQRATA